MSSVNGTLEAVGQDVLSWFQPILTDIFPNTAMRIVAEQTDSFNANQEQYINTAQDVIQYAKAFFGVVVAGMILTAQPLAGLITATAGALTVIGVRDFTSFIVNRDPAEPFTPNTSYASSRGGVSPQVVRLGPTGFTPRFVNVGALRDE